MASTHQYETRNKTTSSNDNHPTDSEILSEMKLSMESSFAEIKDEIINLKEIVIKNLMDENKQLKKKVGLLEYKVQNLEYNLNSLEQYGRRNNLEISGIPESIDITNLEKTAMNLLSAVDAPVEKINIEACHRLGKVEKKAGSRRTIIRFVNRKHCKEALINRRKLKSFDASAIGLNNATIYFNENLTPVNSDIAYRCRLLRKEKKNENTLSKDGVNYIVLMKDDWPLKFTHKFQLSNLFPNFLFGEKVDRENVEV